ncbi:AAA family ATPase [Paenibacillus alvei]|nr:AAA family ATPase [Paenibacillus alvei]
MIYASIITTSLQSAATNTVKQVAAHMYPIELIVKKGESEDRDSKSPFLRKPPAMALKMTARQFAERFSNALPPPLNQWASEHVVDWAGRRAEAAGEWGQARVGAALFKPLLVRYGIQGILKEERIRITHMKLPDIVDKEEPYIAIEVEYDLPMRVPFLLKTITIAARASERVWIGDGPQSRMSGGEANAEGDAPPAFVSLEPDPLLPGRKVKLVIKAIPHEKVELVVFYKSGKSKARHIGWAEADADGNVSWEWLVSGNTTSGEWRLVVNTEDGRTAERQFTVN